MNETPNDQKFEELAARYLAEHHDLHLPTPNHHWRFTEDGKTGCSFGTCDNDVITATSVAPDGKTEWQGTIPDDFYEGPLTMRQLLANLIAYDARAKEVNERTDNCSRIS